MALGYGGHGEHEAPQVAGLVSETQAPPHAWKPALQVDPQVVPLQLTVALAGAGHGEHEAPQLATLVLETQAPPQSWKPALHVDTQTWNAPQTAVAFALVGHTRPQSPQLFGSVELSTQTPPQLSTGHDTAQRPPEQSWPDGHTLPHAPQLLGSASGCSMQRPLQNSWPASQGRHAPATG